MPIKAFPKMSRNVARPAPISDVTLRDFSGGLKVTDNEIALTNKYATRLINMLAESDTSQVLRFGTKEFATLSANVINFIYFQDHLICALADGTIEAVEDDGTVTAIWNETIANALPDTPSGWTGSVTIADFTEFRGDLIVCNGKDKPVLIDSELDVTYLQDLGTGSNINTPIAKYVTTVSNYMVMAGITNSPTEIYVSATGTSGTWPGDAAPNDAISFDVGAYTGQSSSEIKGISNFKNFLTVFFENFSIIFQLGSYNASDVHVPEPIDTYPNQGSVNYKTVLTTETDVIFAAQKAVFSGEKNVFGGTLQTKGLSGDLGDAYPEVLGQVLADDLDSFMVHDPLSSTFFFSFNKSDDSKSIFAMRYSVNYTKIRWGIITGWEFTCAATSSKGRVFFGETNKLYQYGNSVFEDEAFYGDYITDASTGNDIEFDWEMPWLDAGNRIKSKKLLRITFDTTGTSDFTLQCFVNNFYKDLNDDYVPTIEMPFVAGNAGGYGNNAEGYGGDGYGGGRRANDERFYGFPLKFRILKLRLFGATKEPLRVVSISLIYSRGNYNV